LSPPRSFFATAARPEATIVAFRDFSEWAPRALEQYVAAMTKTREQVLHVAVFMAAAATIIAMMVL